MSIGSILTAGAAMELQRRQPGLQRHRWPQRWDSLTPDLGTGKRGGGLRSPRTGSILPISHHLGLSLSW